MKILSGSRLIKKMPVLYAFTLLTLHPLFKKDALVKLAMGKSHFVNFGKM